MEKEFVLQSSYTPAGDQPDAIKQLVEGLESGDRHQVLLGVTGSGKTFTIANVIQEVQRPTIIMSHNKTLAAQLYGEFKTFFPDNLVEYFISYYDYYQPEAFIPATNTYIEKDLSINQEIEKLRLRATSALLSGRKDVIIVSSVSAIYGMGRPEDFKANIWSFKEGEKISLNAFLNKLVDLFYSRTTAEFKRGNFRVKGDTVDVFPAYDDYGLRVMFFGDEVEKIQIFDPESGRKQESLTAYTIFPANLFVTPKDALQTAIKQIQAELMDRVNYFKSVGMFIEAQRLLERTEFDLEMMRELGYCSGIENYSRYLSFRDAGSRPYCLLDYFPEDYLMVLDESHVTIPQIRGMSGGDKSRKMVLVEHGFRLPSAMDNRPQKFDEFDSMINQVIYVSATPADFELQAAGGVVVEQIVRPTGLLDPEVEVRPLINQVDDLLEEIDERTKRGERTLVTTLTKRMAEEMARYLADLKIKCRYIHSEVESLERVDILHDLRSGKIDVLVGVNLLREGLDLPEVTLVAILDADKEGFLRSAQALIQTAGRAARNVDGRVILYADKITPAMKQLMDETTRRRRIQMDYNEKHGITPQTIQRENIDVFGSALGRRLKGEAELEPENTWSVAEGEAEYLTVPVIEERIKILRKDMEAAAKELNFVEAARLRDELFAYQARLKENKR
ncbi:MAG: excinuclease ABC subunit UvrB [Bacteroidetes bacterium]|jgi:excinuclease ABC subunit B|nr:excinuclease ABC subunit UvrB [Bacteroidota bacterium]